MMCSMIYGQHLIAHKKRYIYVRGGSALWNCELIDVNMQNIVNNIYDFNQSIYECLQRHLRFISICFYVYIKYYLFLTYSKAAQFHYNPISQSTSVHIDKQLDYNYVLWLYGWRHIRKTIYTARCVCNQLFYNYQIN